MKHIFVIGAGLSSPYLIDYLLQHAEECDWFVTVGDINEELAQKRIGGHPRGDAIYFDINDEAMRSRQIERADLVICMLAPPFQYIVALDCIHHNAHMISTSYENPQVADLNQDALRKGLLILNEMGLDPGIDHMMAMKMLQDIKSRHGVVTSFISYGSAVPDPQYDTNPLKYCTTWNPRNVVMSGEYGAQYMEEGKIKLLPHHAVFRQTWPVQVDGVGLMEAYPNRDSLIYQKIFQLDEVETMIRATLRFPGWSETWSQIVRLGYPNEQLKIPNLKDRTYAEITEMFLPLTISGSLEERVANYLHINPTGKVMENLRWLGILSDEKVDTDVSTPAEAMTVLLARKLALPPHARDMVILLHKLEAYFPEEHNRKERHISSFIEYGDVDGFTAIAKSVGLPAAIAAKLVLTGKLELTGCRIPMHPAIYIPVLDEMRALGREFKENVETIAG
ncbi:MAG: saccharopine dehydrogenase [Gemmatimonadetes bacterium]|nr:MAG: saccharopine dehydrogenase [Gemmatimonadota bacterium]